VIELDGRGQAADLFHQERGENGIGQIHPPLRPAQNDQHKKEEVETRDWLPDGQITVGVTAGASCPNNLIEDTIRRLFELRGISVQKLLAN
jgi:4-hydroxy-3-methylbut-2-enyl diphosphate reductase